MTEPEEPVESGDHDVEARTGPLLVDEVTLNLGDAPQVERPLAARVLLPEPMLRYACNQQGCCCGGWRIGFKPSDLVKLGRHLAPGDKEKLTRDVEFRVRIDEVGARVVDEFVVMDDDRLCRFLESDRQRCGIHARYGLELLPELCVDFPVATFTEGAGAAFYFDPVCPSVLEQLGETSDPLGIVEVSAPYPDEAFTLRARHTKGVVVLKAGEADVSAQSIDALRRAVIASLGDFTKPVWRHLQAIETAFAQLGPAASKVPEFSYEHAPGPFLQHLGNCLGAHGRNALESSFNGYRRFIFAIAMTPESGDWERFGHHLEHWGEAYERHLGPSEDALRALQLRYLALCHVTPYAAPSGQLPRFAGAITHRLSTALRYASALGAVFGRDVDAAMMKVALGAAEYFYRSRTIAPELMPWYAPPADSSPEAAG